MYKVQAWNTIKETESLYNLKISLCANIFLVNFVEAKSDVEKYSYTKNKRHSIFPLNPLGLTKLTYSIENLVVVASLQ